MYRYDPHPTDLPGRNLNIPHPNTVLPSHILIGDLLDDYNAELEKNKVQKALFEVKFTKDDIPDITSYNNIMKYLS